MSPAYTHGKVQNVRGVDNGSYDGVDGPGDSADVLRDSCATSFGVIGMLMGALRLFGSRFESTLYFLFLPPRTSDRHHQSNRPST